MRMVVLGAHGSPPFSYPVELSDTVDSEVFFPLRSLQFIASAGDLLGAIVKMM